MKKLITYSLLLLVAFVHGLRAQAPAPVKAQDKKIVLTGGVAHLGNGQVIQNAVIGFDMGKLTIVADAATNPNLAGYEEIKITGKHVYPGFILPNTQLGLMEVSSIRAMNDYNEHGEMNPNVRAIVAYNTDSEYIPTMRYNGILLAEATPTGGTISGSSAVVEMEGWNWEDAAHTVDVAIHLNWPPKMKREFDFATFTFAENANKDYDKNVTDLEQFFSDAHSFAKLAHHEPNLKMEAMQGIFDGKKTLFIHADNPKEIIESVRFAQKHNVQRIAIVTATGAFLVAEFLKENKIPVILTAIHELPERADDDVDMPYKQPYLLSAAGVTVSLSHDGMLGQARNLAFYAGTAVAYGMDKEEALKTITSNTAKALGIDARVGTLEVGKDATLFVSNGDVLDFRTSTLTHAYISGKLVTLLNKHQELYERFSKKYGHEKE
jgi:imidazolonepropionase-like amidohydrolase